MKLLKLLPIFLMLVFISSSCSDDETKCDKANCKDTEVCIEKTGECRPKEDKCKDVTCTDGKTCDPADGVCKGGDVDKCKDVTCTDPATCNPDTGKCEEPSNIKTIVALRTYGITISDVEKIVDGELLTTKLEGVVIGVKGNKSLKKYGIYVQQAGATENAGVYVDLYKFLKDDNFTEPKIGDVVKFKGQHAEFYSQTRVTPAGADDFEIGTGTGTITPIEVNGNDFVEKYESMLVKMKDAPFITTEASSNSNHYNTTLKDSKNVVFTMNSALHHPYYDVPKDSKLTKIIGVMSFDHDFKIFPRTEADLEIEVVLCGTVECTDTQYCKDDVCVEKVEKEDTEELCSDGLDNDGDGHLDCDDYDCNGTDACDKCKDKTCDNGQECDPEDGVCKAPQAVVAISVVRAGEDGTTFTTEGVVTTVINHGFYMQDEVAGIYVNTGDAPTILVGEKVKVQGKKGTHYGLESLSEPIIKSHVADTMPAYTDVDAANIENLEAQESMIVNFLNPPFTVTEVVTGNAAGDFKMKDANNKPFLIRNSYLDFTPVVNDTFTHLSGVLKYAYGNYKLYPRVLEDIGQVTITCDPACGDWQTCENDGTDNGVCTIIEGRCDDANPCAGAGTCTDAHICEYVCTPVCEEWQTCGLVDNAAACIINEDRCDDANPCSVGTCTDAHVCELVGTDDVANGDFEAWTGDLLDQWVSKSGLVVEKETVLFHGGVTSAKITRTADASNSSAQLDSAIVNVEPTKEYTLKLWVSDSNATLKARLGYQFMKTDGTFGPAKWNNVYTTDNANWQELTMNTPAAAADTKAVKVLVRIYKEGTATGSIYFDDATVVELTK